MSRSLRLRPVHRGGGGDGVRRGAGRPAPAAARARSSRWPARSCTTRPSRSATRPWRSSATSCARRSTSRPGCATPRSTSRGATARERSHVHAVTSHVRGDSRPLVAHLREYPRDALLLSTAVPTIAFAGVTEVPQEAWAIVERAIPAYGDDWWFTGLLAFVRQEQRRFDEAMELSCRSLAVEPAAGHSAHARAHAHYETGDHEDGLAWMDAWVTGDGATTESLSHFSWHAALHELSLGDMAAVRRRYDAQLRPEHGLGCRALVDSGSLLFRWAITPDAERRAGHGRRRRRHRPRRAGAARRRRSWPCTRRSRCSRPTTGPACSGSPTGRIDTRIPPSARWSPHWRGRWCCCTTGDVRRRPTRWPGCGATYPVSAAPTPSASWSRRPGSARSCGRAGTSTPARCWTHGWTAATRRATDAGARPVSSRPRGPLRPA